MGSETDGWYSYTDGTAELYGLLGIEGTTYQIGFDAVAKLLGDITGKTFLDFGCGTGRSARPRVHGRFHARAIASSGCNLNR